MDGFWQREQTPRSVAYRRTSRLDVWDVAFWLIYFGGCFAAGILFGLAATGRL